MKYVILRDDDTNGTTPVKWLEPLYRPFLERGFPVHLATIPYVRTDVRRSDGDIERYLFGERAGRLSFVPIENNADMLDYLRHEIEYVPVMHGLTHEFINGDSEFFRDEASDIASRLEQGLAHFRAANLGWPRVFVAPQDRLTRASFREVMKRFSILSTRSLSLDILPRRYWPTYLRSRAFGRNKHIHNGSSTVLTHPGCILSNTKPLDGMLDRLLRIIHAQDVTVVVSHHWEYFDHDGLMNESFVAVLHAFAEYLSKAHEVRVVRMDEMPELLTTKRLAWYSFSARLQRIASQPRGWASVD
jgi:Uncharacterized protein conserved in bacteria (DUF2334)